MAIRKPVRRARANGVVRPFSAEAFLESRDLLKTLATYARGETIFGPGDKCDGVLYIRHGGVKLSVLSSTGREAVVALLGPGDFFGEGCLVGHALRTGSATAITPSDILHIPSGEMSRLLRDEHDMSDRFISHMLSRNIRIEEDLVDQLFNSIEKRLARALLKMARQGQQVPAARALPRISHATLAELVGTTAAKVGFFLKKFKRMGFIDCRGEQSITVKRALLNVVLHD